MNNPIQVALKKAFRLGENYWMYGDSDSFKDNAKADIAWEEFQKLLATFEEQTQDE